jgi:hypothetical protein
MKAEPFEIVTYAGSDLGGFRADGVRPPRTAKLVAEVSWSWSPAHSRCDRYLICTDRNRIAWTLWAMANDFAACRCFGRQRIFNRSLPGVELDRQN